ncbi:MAG: AbrB/MazE/SpoVT family DNA-binding domain-containing protein [Thaumarchaeota archaeon]|nr:AbrB/MazE/SpoVT family DNA-binding domain-containing protein [Nitrososphaerota archaeon]
MIRNRCKIGQKGEVVIPKEIRDMRCINPGSEVLVEMRGNEIVIKKSLPTAESYVDYFISSYSKKRKQPVSIKKFIEGESFDRVCVN